MAATQGMRWYCAIRRIGNEWSEGGKKEGGKEGREERKKIKKDRGEMRIDTKC